MILLSIIIPVHNEEDIIEDTINSIAGTLENKKEFFNKYAKKYDQEVFSYELVIMEDGSTDNTVKILEKIKSNINVPYRYYTSKKRKGKGYAFIKGLEYSKGKYVLLFDADSSVSPDFILDAYKEICNNADIVIASRNLPESKRISDQRFTRKLLGKGYILIVKLLFGLKFSDFQCGFKMMKRESVIGLGIVSTGFEFDTELLIRAVKNGLTIKEIPVVWRNRDKSSIRPIDCIRMFFGLLRLKLKLGL